MTHIKIPEREYPEAVVGAFHSNFHGNIHVWIDGGEEGSVDLTPSEARHLRKVLKSAIREAEEAA